LKNFSALPLFLKQIPWSLLQVFYCGGLPHVGSLGFQGKESTKDFLNFMERFYENVAFACNHERARSILSLVEYPALCWIALQKPDCLNMDKFLPPPVLANWE